MNEDTTDNRDKIEDIFLFTAQEVSEKSYEKYINGEISQEDLQKVYKLLSNWSINSEKILNLLHQYQDK